MNIRFIIIVISIASISCKGSLTPETRKDGGRDEILICSRDKECPEGQRCWNGVCVQMCESDEECGEGKKCDAATSTCVSTEGVDSDEDGYFSIETGGNDCDDTDASIYPEAEDICDNGIDEDCNGRDRECGCADADGDGYLDINCGGNDCNDNTRLINPSQPEICDGNDNNCDGQTDEGIECGNLIASGTVENGNEHAILECTSIWFIDGLIGYFIIYDSQGNSPIYASNIYQDIYGGDTYKWNGNQLEKITSGKIRFDHFEQLDSNYWNTDGSYTISESTILKLYHQDQNSHCYSREHYLYKVVESRCRRGQTNLAHQPNGFIDRNVWENAARFDKGDDGFDYVQTKKQGSTTQNQASTYTQGEWSNFKTIWEQERAVFFKDSWTMIHSENTPNIELPVFFGMLAGGVLECDWVSIYDSPYIRVTDLQEGQKVELWTSTAPIQDIDGDGYSTPRDCDDTDPSIHPEAAEVCNDVDDDCDDEIDENNVCLEDRDGDGFNAQIDCDDSDQNVYPGAQEICNEKDDDCDDEIDEGDVCISEIPICNETKCLIPAGPFIAGCTELEGGGPVSCEQLLEEKNAGCVHHCCSVPTREVNIPYDYWIDKYEVTNGRYKECVDAGACPSPERSGSFTREWYFGNPQYDNYPVVYVWAEHISAFCGWAGGRVVTAIEWEKAARGPFPDSRVWPWGNEQPECSRGHCCGAGDTVPVDTYPANTSPYGVMDMTINVWEVNATCHYCWLEFYPYDYDPMADIDCLTIYLPGEAVVVRSGQWWTCGATLFQHAEPWRGCDEPGGQLYCQGEIGFRCVYPVGSP